MICPFCNEGDFDLIGLKWHIQGYECDPCELLPSRYEHFREQVEARRNLMEDRTNG